MPGQQTVTLARLSNQKRATKCSRSDNRCSGSDARARSCRRASALYDTGRFLGIAAAMLLVQQRAAYGLIPGPRTIDNAPFPVRIGRLAVAGLAFAAIWRATYATLEGVGLLHTPADALLAGGIPAFALLPAPLVLGHLLGIARVRVLAARGRWRTF